LAVDRKELVEALETTGRGMAIGFMILLVAAAVLLAAGGRGLANQLATAAYFSLAGSVLLLLLSEALRPDGDSA